MRNKFNFPKDEFIQNLQNEFSDLNFDKIKIIFRIAMFGQGLFANMEKHFGRYGFTKGKFHCLSYLYLMRNSKQDIVLSELAKTIQVTKSTITGLIDGLENLNFVERFTDKTIDRRKVFVRLTARGEATFREIFPDHVRRITAMFDGISDSELDGFITTFGKLYENMKNFNLEKYEFKGVDNEA